MSSKQILSLLSKDELDPTTWSHLPLELIHEILLFLASISTHTACLLRLLSKDTNRLIVPHLFRDIVFNTTDRIMRFASSLSPRRPVLIPALRKRFVSMPLNLVDYHVDSLTIVVNKRLPSVEGALGAMAPMFCRVKKLAVTGDQLLANAHWMRRHPLRPRVMMIVHHGRPPLLNFREPVFSEVTHLYTSSLYGHHNNSTVLDLPNLTHLCVTSRLGISPPLCNSIASFLYKILTTSQTLQSLVFCLNLNLNLSTPQDAWLGALKPCMADKRFILIPYHPLPRMQWRNIILGRMSIWEKALNWRALDLYSSSYSYSSFSPSSSSSRSSTPHIWDPRTSSNSYVSWDSRELMKKKEMLITSIQTEQTAFIARVRCPEGEWEADLVEREGYEPPDMDPDQRGGFFGG